MFTIITGDKIEEIYKETQPHFVENGDAEGYQSHFADDAVW